MMHCCDHDNEASSSIKCNKRDYLGSRFVADSSSQYLLLSENLFQIVFI